LGTFTEIEIRLPGIVYVCTFCLLFSLTEDTYSVSKYFVYSDSSNIPQSAIQLLMRVISLCWKREKLLELTPVDFVDIISELIYRTRTLSIIYNFISTVD
jgi:hypothetical protein